MRIAIISTMSGFSWGGSEELWAAMANEALNESLDVAVSVYRWPSNPPKLLELQQKGAQIFQRYNPGLQSKHAIIRNVINKLVSIYQTNPKYTVPFREILNLNPDVVCINQGSTYDLVYWRGLLSYLYKMSIPYVVLCQANNDAYILNRINQKAAIEFFEHASRVLFVSHNNMRLTERQIAKILPNALVLQNPVNLSDITVVAWPDSEILCMASVARLDATFKGQDVLFEALSQVWQSRDWRLRLYGTGSDKDYLEALAKHYGISERVEFRGHVEDVRAIWLENHLLVLPSRAEGTPLALIEAMLCGRPSVVTDVGGNAEWVKELQTGFIAEAPTAKSFSAALERAWLAQDNWKQMGVKAHEYATARLDNSPGRSLLKIVLDATKQ